MKQDSLISVIIPAYNPGKEFPKVLQSILNQTHKTIEVIIVDDGSLHPVATEFRGALSNKNIRILRQENQGAPVARNRGFDESKGDFVIFWDADIIGEPDMLEKMLKALHENPASSYAYTSFYFGRIHMRAVPFSADLLRQKNYIHTTSLIRRNDFPGFDQKLKRFQDWDLWLTLLAHNKIGILVQDSFFTVIPQKTGISAWIPSWCYTGFFSKLPIIRTKVLKYREAEKIIRAKHGI